MSFFRSSTGLKERCQRMSLKSSILSQSICTTAMARAQAQYIELGLKKSRLVWASKKRASFYFSPGSCFNYSICIFHSFISEEKKRKNFLFQKRCSIHFWIFWELLLVLSRNQIYVPTWFPWKIFEPSSSSLSPTLLSAQVWKPSDQPIQVWTTASRCWASIVEIERLNNLTESLCSWPPGQSWKHLMAWPRYLNNPS